MSNQNTLRKKWKEGSVLEIYSNSKQKWFIGEIIKIFVDASDIEWLKVKYNDNEFKEIQRENELIRPYHKVLNETKSKILVEKQENDDSDIDKETEDILSLFSDDEIQKYKEIMLIPNNNDDEKKEDYNIHDELERLRELLMKKNKEIEKVKTLLAVKEDEIIISKNESIKQIGNEQKESIEPTLPQNNNNTSSQS